MDEKVSVAGPGVGKIAIGVFLGVMLAAVVLGGIFYFSVELPREKQAAADADYQVRMDTARMTAENSQIEAENRRIEDQIRKLQPGSPCNSLDGDSFNQCNKLSSTPDKKRFAAAHAAKLSPTK